MVEGKAKLTLENPAQHQRHIRRDTMQTTFKTQDGRPFWMNRKAWYTFGALVLLLVFNPFTCVDAGHKALRFTMGALDEVELDEGLNFSVPLVQKIREVTIQPIEHTFSIVVGPEGAITKDNQSIGVTISVFFAYVPGQLVPMWRNYGEEKLLAIIAATCIENYKKVAGTYTIFEVAGNQEKIRNQVAEMTKANMATYPMKITEVKITNYDWSDAFEKQIEETMSRAQQVKQKEQELLITEQEAQKEVKQSNAKKTSMITLAEGRKESARLDADAKALEGEGIRKYNESIRLNMAQEIEFRRLGIEKIKAEKWDGAYVPTNNYGPIPLQTGALQPTK